MMSQVFVRFECPKPLCLGLLDAESNQIWDTLKVTVHSKRNQGVHGARCKVVNQAATAKRNDAKLDEGGL